MRDCAVCGRTVADEFRFCPWCAAPQRRKIVEFFRAHPLIEGDAGKALRVSRYLADHHVRVSIWRDGEAAAAVSLDEAEADRLAQFLQAPRARRRRLPSFR
jgi:hypothetical protein